MTRRFWCAAPLLLAAAGSANADWEGSILPRGFAYESSLDKAVEAAKGSGKAAIVYYTRTNCPPCQALQARLRKDEIGLPFKDGYVFTAVWGSSMGQQERESYRSRYAVQGAPTWLVFNRHGKYVCTAAGGFGSDEAGLQLHKAVQALLTSASEGESTASRACT